jgi:probable phosphoglycerate mutase
MTDLPLTENGKRQAEQLKARLHHIDFGHVFTSPLHRARNTCMLCGYEATLDPDLVEWNYGQYEGKTTPEIRTKNPKWNLFAQGAPGGESPQDVEKRADRVLSKIRNLSGNILLFSSAHILRVLAARYLQLAASEGRYFLLSPASLSVLSQEHGTPVIALWNDISHLSYK